MMLTFNATQSKWLCVLLVLIFGCHSIVVGALSRLVVAIHCMSKVCNKCKLEQAHDKTIYPKNYEGTSGGMEPHGAIVNANWLWKNGCYICECCMDDDATTRNQMKPYRSWTNSRNRLIEEGKLPPEHPGLKFLCDMNHHLRCMSRKEYALAYAALKVSTLNYVDAMCLKKIQGMQ
jgi:hypothetical protein